MLLGLEMYKIYAFRESSFHYEFKKILCHPKIS